MAPKANATSSTIDAAGYEWTTGCAACHPGGGPVEFDRDGARYDERDPASVTEFDGDYWHTSGAASGVAVGTAAWKASGVLEADCLLCHMESYRTADRTPQVAAGRFRVAPVAGARMGVPRDNAVVDYDVNFALDFGRPKARNCSQCHGGTPTELFNAPGVLKSDIAKRGMSWGDANNPDAHSANLECVDCHRSGTAAGAPWDDHQFRKGNVMVGSGVRNDLDHANGFLSCDDCHAPAAPHGMSITPPVPDHGALAGHLDTIHCSTCHIPELKLFAVNAFDFTEGAKNPFFIGGSPANPYQAGFKPSFLWWHDEATPAKWKIYPFNTIAAVFWNRGGESRDALFLKQVKPVFDALKAAGKLTNDVPDSGSVPEPNTAAEIAEFRTALTAAGVADPKIWISPDAFQISHNVSPVANAKTLGRNGCADCHTPNSPFFSRTVQLLPGAYDFPDTTHVVMEMEIHDPAGAPATIAGFRRTIKAWELLGYTAQRKDQLENLFAPAAVK